MKKILLLVSIICSAFITRAQHYQCFQRDSNVHWYVDTIGYLRAIRLDSITVQGADTVYYPFLSNRGLGPSSSWLGRTVHEQPGGNFLFNNKYGDTVIIKTQAGSGDSWIFYNDTSNRYFTATVTSVDTMTIGGTIDSVKYVIVNTYAPSLDTYDYANNFSFIISKYHGLAQAFDLYNFPYHPAGMPVVPSDAYFQLTQYPARAQLFHRFDFRIPTMLEMYDYHPGDVFQYHTNTYCGCPASGGPEKYEHDTIIYRSDPDPYHAIIVMQKTICSRYVYCATPFATTLALNTPFIDTLRLDTSAAFNIHPLPEEDSQRLAYYYYEADTSFCRHSPLIHWIKSSIFEECSDEKNYKIGLGPTFIIPVCYHCDPIEPSMNEISTTLIYYRKDGLSCRDRYPLEIKEITPTNSIFTISPNPASDIVTITMLSGCIQGEYCLFNNVGQILRKGTANSNLTTLDVSQIVDGLYYLAIKLQDGSKITVKLAIKH